MTTKKKPTNKKQVQEEKVDTNITFEERVAQKLGIKVQEENLQVTTNDNPEPQVETYTFDQRAFMHQMQTAPL